MSGSPSSGFSADMTTLQLSSGTCKPATDIGHLRTLPPVILLSLPQPLGGYATLSTCVPSKKPTVVSSSQGSLYPQSPQTLPHLWFQQ